jgi:hypothetical protein
MRLHASSFSGTGAALHSLLIRILPDDSDPSMNKEPPAMCDYSLHGIASRPAKVGDKLVTTEFRNTLTRGFAEVSEPNVAVCLLPGTELAFEAEVQRQHAWLQTLFFRKERWNTGQKVGRFRQINVDNPATHHDAVEFADGQVVLLTRLRPGQRAAVLQLPARPQGAAEAKAPQHASRPAQVR